MKSTLRVPSLETRANDFELPLKSLENLTENFQTDSWRKKQWNRNSWLEILENLHGYTLQGWRLLQTFFRKLLFHLPLESSGNSNRNLWSREKRSQLGLFQIHESDWLRLDVVHSLFNSH